jgi:spore germination protein KC
LIRLEISVEGFISSQTGSVNVAAPDNAERLTENTENTIKREIETTIRKAQALGADIFGFDSCFYRSYPREWMTLEPKWGEVFRNIRVETDVTVTIKGSGNLAKPLYPE